MVYRSEILFWKMLFGSAVEKSRRYILHPIITDAYRCDIKNSINEIIGTTKYDVVFKEDILDILKEITEIKQDTMNGIERN